MLPLKRTLISFLQTLALLLVVSQTLSARYNPVRLLGHLNQPHGLSGQGTSFSSCWGWTSPDGKEYALLGCYTGTSIIDLNGDSLREVQFIPGPPAVYAYREIKTYSHYAYIVSEGGSGVQIVDLSGLPDTAILVRNFIYTSTTPPDSGKSIMRSHTVALAGGYLYLNGSVNWSPSGVVIFSLREDPENPVFAGQFQPAPTQPGANYIHDSYIRNDTLYGAAIYSGGGLYVADVRDKSNPVILGKATYTGSGTHHAWASVDGNYAFTTDEIGSSGQDLKVWRITDLSNIVRVGTYQASPTDIIHNVHGRGHFLYISHYTAGARVVNVRDPETPIEIGFYSTYSGQSGIFSGCWGVYPYFPSGRWIASDMLTGLYLLGCDSLAPRKRPALLGPPDGEIVAGPGPGPFRWTAAASQSDDPHFYRVHLRGNGFDSMFTTTDTTFELSPGILPESGGVYAWSVSVHDEYTDVAGADTFHFTQLIEDVPEPGAVPASIALYQNYPNPFNPRTVIPFDLDRPSRVTLRIFNALGVEVRRLLDDAKLDAGRHEVGMEGWNLPSGLYFYHVKLAGGTSRVKAMVLVR